MNVAPTTMARIELFQGEAILGLAGKYPYLALVIKEAVQNGLDNGASKIVVKINKKQRQISIADNGNGVTVTDFLTALASVGKSVKTKDKLGRFGIGMVSPLGKCKYFTFTSCPDPCIDRYEQWRLETNHIRSQRNNVDIPQTPRPDLRFSTPDHPTPIWWRTEVRIHDYTEDKIISNVDLEDLKSQLVSSFSRVMLRNRTVIHLSMIDEHGHEEVVKPFRGDTFTGTELPVVELRDQNCGRVVFRMYLATKRQQEKRRAASEKVNILTGELDNDFRVEFSNFSRSVTTSGWGPNQETMEAFRSGIFEGEILGEKISIAKERTFFERDDALVDFYLMIDKWYEQHGKQHFNLVKKQNREERYANLGIKTLDTLSELLKSQENHTLLDTIRSLGKYGTTGNKHTPITPVGVQASKSIAATGPKQSGGSGGGGGGGGSGKRERPEHTPLTQQGPHGTRRNIVKNNSLGLQLCHDAISGSNDRWQLDREYGIMILNITHPDWVLCDNNDTMICWLQERLIIQMLTLEAMPDKESYYIMKQYADELIKYEVQIVNQKGSAQRQRVTGRGRPAKKAG